ncbi:hypothetical protein SFRURICE_004045 [Spodoptera frugiperda]|nr:hypothetical protein SFRURICE_004045 [Spodoptera frugiperda]
MNEEEKTAIIQNLNLRVGNDINDLKSTLQIQAELTTKRDLLLKNLNAANNEVPQKLAAALEKAELNSSHIDKLKSRSDELKKKVEAFLDKTEPLRTEFDKRFAAINKLEEVLIYLKSFEKIDDLRLDIFDDDNELRTYRDEIEEIRNFRNIGSRSRVKIYNSRSNPMEELSESDFKHRYRFSKENMPGRQYTCGVASNGSYKILGRHEIQEDCAEIHGMSQQTLSRTAKRVAIALASKSSIYIKMSSNLREETETIRKFETICGFPHITGAIDCTILK